MRQATRMMLMDKHAGKSGKSGEGHDMQRGYGQGERSMNGYDGMGDRSMGSRDMRGREDYDMRSEMGRYADHGRERGYRGPQRMYASGSIWADDGESHTPGKHGKRHGEEDYEVDEQKAMQWVGKMRNADGSTGPHFKPEVAEQLRAAHCPKCDKWEFMVALNMMYSDYADVAKKFGADKPEFYVHMAKAFLEDEDAGEDKLAKYMECIPEK